MKNFKNLLPLIFINGIADSSSPLFVRCKEEEGPKNKFNLTPDQIEAMSEMTPKEKKKYLKSLRGETNESK